MRSCSHIKALSVLLLITACVQNGKLAAQRGVNQSGIFFHQLNTAHGLSDNYVQDMCMDKSGNLWIATGEGLNMFNGKTVTKFFKSEYPQFRSDNSRQVVCDASNRVWAMSRSGSLTLIDEKRKLHRISIMENQKPVEVKWVIKTKNGTVILYTDAGFFSMPAVKDLSASDSLTVKDFSSVIINGFDSIRQQVFTKLTRLDDDRYIFSNDAGFYTIDFTTGKVEKSYRMPAVTVLTKWKAGALLLYDRTRQELQSVDLATGIPSNPFKGLKDQYGNEITARITNAGHISKDQLLMTTFKHGLYIYHFNTGKLFSYRHNAADPTTVINNNPNLVLSDSSGWVFIGASPNGISYFKTNAVIGQQTIFQDRLGNNYDGYINNITTRDNDVYYIGVSDNLLEWKRSTNTTQFVNYAQGTGETVINNESVSFITFDPKDRLWIATGTSGIYVIDRNKKLVKHLTADTTKTNYIPRSFIWHMKMQPDGYMWIAGRDGICRIDINTFETEHFNDLSLSAINSKKPDVRMVFFSDPDHGWFATRLNGLYEWRPSLNKLNVYTTKDGLPSDDVICMNKDRSGNLYVGTAEGLCIFLTNGKKKIITTKNGLQNNRVEALLLDKHDRMWMGNDVGLSCFSIADSSLRTFDERYGLSIQGFRMSSYHQNNDDELVWGTEKGIQYFYPDDLLAQKISLRSVIQKVETSVGVYNLTSNISLDLPAKGNSVNFYFSSIEYTPSLRTFYRYKLEGSDQHWVTVADQNSVRYSSLAPGTYHFRLQASNDGKDWQDAENAVSIHIAKPLLQQWWVKLAGVILGVLLIGMVINFYRKKQDRKRNELEAELVITYFASQINSHRHTDDLLWDVAKNCISKLQFEDCVIYLKDPVRNVLVQKAAYGPKNPVDFTIHAPMDIPIGEGIVGTVARTGKYELVDNTESDKRYIVDDQKRLSEIAVPIVIDGEVIGVIDSEHSQRHFFTSQHLQILSTVAVLCANQIQRTRAEEDKRKAGLELLENKQKAMESRLQSLRLQMNPHFLFNALNSIQQMILANEDIVATKYLSRFSKLLRAILVHSDKETISLKEELDILNLYIELESIRFKESFSYKIVVDKDIEVEEVRIPTLLVQPFVENAIWHGLMHKEGERILKVEFKEEGDFIQCTVEDNGIGRKKADEMKIVAGKDKKHTSKGIAVSNERLKSLRTTDGREGSIHIEDILDKQGQPAGTKVIIHFPIQN